MISESIGFQVFSKRLNSIRGETNGDGILISIWDRGWEWGIHPPGVWDGDGKGLKISRREWDRDDLSQTRPCNSYACQNPNYFLSF